MLYLVGTPIGNLEDITLRALRVLREVPLIAAEDTRITRRLLQRYDIKTRITSFHDHSGDAKLGQLVEHMRTLDLALVSEAGMPNISDPGHDLVAAAIENSITVVPIPGPTAAVSAVAVSGLPTAQFTFVGFLPRKASERRKLLASVLQGGRTVVAYEAPHRLLATLNDIYALAPDVEVAVCRELTKLHEEVFRGTASDAVNYFDKPRGEFTLVIGPSHQPDTEVTDEELAAALTNLETRGIMGREAVERVSGESGVGRNSVYRVWVEGKSKDDTDEATRAHTQSKIC